MDDPQVAELKELVRQNIALSQETNKMVHKMRGAARLKSFFWLIILLLSIASSLYTYYYFIQPRVTQITNFYDTNVAPLQGASNGVLEFFRNFGHQATTSAQ